MSVHNESVASEANDSQSPVFTPTADAGKVRLGGLGPVFKDVADVGKVRLGGLSPLFR